MKLSVHSMETAMRKVFGPAVRLYWEATSNRVWFCPDHVSRYPLRLHFEPRAMVDELHDLLDAIRVFQDGEIIWG